LLSSLPAGAHSLMCSFAVICSTEHSCSSCISCMSELICFRWKREHMSEHMNMLAHMPSLLLQWFHTDRIEREKTSLLTVYHLLRHNPIGFMPGVCSIWLQSPWTPETRTSALVSICADQLPRFSVPHMSIASAPCALCSLERSTYAKYSFIYALQSTEPDAELLSIFPSPVAWTFMLCRCHVARSCVAACGDAVLAAP
jgi:hypothetical protein